MCTKGKRFRTLAHARLIINVYIAVGWIRIKYVILTTTAKSLVVNYNRVVKKTVQSCTKRICQNPEGV